MARARQKIGIIGGGASGALAALHCGLELGDRAELVVFEPSERLGLGRAYATTDLGCLLNVPASKMSAYPDRPDDFVAWLRGNVPDAESSPHWPFVPRHYFGRYLGDQLGRVRLSHVRARVLAVRAEGSGYRLELSGRSGTQHVDALVVATGHRPERWPRFATALRSLRGRVLQSQEVETAGDVSGDVLVIGTGLTAIDVWRRLNDRPATRVRFFSRHGLLPAPHAENIPAVPEAAGLAGQSPRAVLSRLRAIAQDRALPWAALADAVRPQCRAVWAAWSPRERTRFLEHLKPYWEVIRHRVPRSVAAELETARSAGGLEILTGQIRSAREIAGHRIRVTYAPRGPASARDSETTSDTDWIVLATGSVIDQELVRDGDVPGLRRCPHGFGFINDGARGVWLVGPASKATLWEITAVPDIREQARELARGLALEIAGD